MRFPFTADQFLDVFRRYNEAVWPAQWLLVALGVVVIGLACRDDPRADRSVSGLLAVLWFWMALTYQLAFFADVTRVGVAFGVAFGAQGVLFAWLAVRRDRTSYRPRSATTMGAGALLIGYALVAYPVLGYFLGHRYPASPTFGVPCPTAIFTLGLIAWSSASIPRRLVVVPAAWAIVGTSAAVNLGMTEDFGLLAAALLTAATLVATPRGTRFSGGQPSRVGR